jgi:predicted nucleic acid-binding protein
MAASILDASVLVALAEQDRFELLRGIDEPRLVPDIVDEELALGQAKHPEHYARYAQAIAAGLITVAPIRPGERAYDEYLRLRSTRTSPARNRGEDACVALALALAGSVVFTNDHRGASRARTELGDSTRARSFP